MTDKPDNVISLKHRKALVTVQMEEAKTKDELTEIHKAALLKVLAGVTKMVEDDRLESLVILGRDPVTGLMMTETLFPGTEKTMPHAFAYLGLLETVKLEMSDLASMSPYLTVEGKIIDPYKNMMSEEEAEEFEGSFE